MVVTLQSCFKLGLNVMLGAEYINHVLPVAIFRERVNLLKRPDDNNCVHQSILKVSRKMTPKYNLDKTAKLYLDRYPYSATPFGNSIVSHVQKAIIVDENIWKIDSLAGKWLMRHQCTLLKNNYILKASGAKYAALFASSLLLPLPLALATTCASGIFLNDVVFKNKAQQQDLESFNEASQQELLGAVRYLRAYKLAENEYRKSQSRIRKKFDSFLSKFAGFERAASQRLEDAKSVLRRRFPGISIKKICHDPQVEQLKSYLLGAMVRL
jgi:hypothetical protein